MVDPSLRAPHEPEAVDPPASGVRALTFAERHLVAVIAPSLTLRRTLDDADRSAEAARAAGVCQPVPARARRPLTDAGLHLLVVALAPLGDVDAIGGLSARYRDPRELPGTGGEQRDAAAALDNAVERGQLAAARVAWNRYRCLDADLRRTAWWIAQRGRAVRDGAIVGVAEWSLTYGALEGPGADRERYERLRIAAEGARLRAEGLKRSTRGGCSAELAREISDARALHTQASGALTDVTDRLRAWGLARFESLAVAWEAEKERSEAA